ncbi:MAG: hypothetical protein RL131_16 [Bacteroidota bacterium]
MTYLQDVENMSRQHLEELLGPIDDSSWAQACLPTRLGGLGIASPSKFATCAFLGSYFTVLPTVSLLLSSLFDSLDSSMELSMLQQFNEIHLPADAALTPTGLSQLLTDGVKLQSHLTHISESLAFSSLSQSLDPSQRLWLHSCAKYMPHWVRCCPNKQVGTFMQNQDFRLAILNRIRGLRFPLNASCTSGENDHMVLAIDPNGHHCTGCKNGGGIHRRHDKVVRVIFDEASLAGIQASMEPPNLISDNQSRPGDIFFPFWSFGRSLAMDISIVVPTRFSDNIHSAEHNAQEALETAYQEKVKKHAENCRNHGIMFQPLIFDTAGSIHPQSYKFLLEIVKLRALRLGLSNSEALHQFFHRLSATLQIGNAQCILYHDTCMKLYV